METEKAQSLVHHQTWPARGMLLVVVGPSGAGKDSLINCARKALSACQDVHFIQRVITRPREAVNETSGGEDHCPLSRDAFEQWKAEGRFILDWQAHGLCYGIPLVAAERLREGCVVVVNGSRSVLPHFAHHFSPLKVINITARPEVLADRLEARGRESREDILKRLQRSGLEIHGHYDVLTIDNSGLLDDAAKNFIAEIQTCRVACLKQEQFRPDSLSGSD